MIDTRLEDLRLMCTTSLLDTMRNSWSGSVAEVRSWRRPAATNRDASQIPQARSDLVHEVSGIIAQNPS
ncbi:MULTISPECIES: hypothetical protein [unclassified Bradyrhizobium]|uniref:hypothetical protein n=1 Tax=unclassified Bradyrhizobium TaxID=2631580 RepID=UPI002916A10A|nr:MULTISPECIES: hypothetical protein [unclassified Bradyrhizobium]